MALERSLTKEEIAKWATTGLDPEGVYREKLYFSHDCKIAAISEEILHKLEEEA